VVFFADTFVGDFANPDFGFDEFHQFSFRTAYGNAQLAIFILVLPGKRDSAFPVYEPGNISGVNFP